jgi:uncharacterized protein (DUF362 family)
MKYNRREFIKTAALGTAALGAGALLSRGGAWAQEPPLVRVVQVTSPGVMTDTGPDPARVLEMVKRGLLEITGQGTVPAAWARFVQPTDVVGLKINPLGAPLLTTHREVVLAIAQTLQESGLPAAQIVVWDRGQADLGKAGWTVTDEAGKLRVLASDVAGYDEAAYCDCDPPNEQGNRRSRFSKLLTQRTTRLVNVPVLKHHANCGMSMALKNLTFGVCDNVSRGHVDHCAKFIPTLFAQPTLQQRLTLVIADALRPQYAGGPGGNVSQQWNYDSLLFAVGQPSADAVGLAILDAKRQELGLPPVAQTEDKPDYLAAVGAAGLGIVDLEKIKWDIVTL